ncbi:MAG: glucosidase [Planctomycetota bacterium]
MSTDAGNAEQLRLNEDENRTANWKRWGPYLAERQWGTVREDYSPDGDSWNHFTHDHARSRAYRWGEDGLLGITDRQGRVCFALALWNHKDPYLKERLFGLAGPEGNHGEDVKEEYFYLESTPTHSYMKALYKYPQAEFPYQQLIDENARRSKTESEFELRDTGVFDENRYFDVVAEYAKAAPNDLLIQITITNRGPDPAEIDCLPNLWCRNTWAYGRSSEGYWRRPRMERQSASHVTCEHDSLGLFHWLIEPIDQQAAPPLLFTENESNQERLYGIENEHPYVKDAFHEYVVENRQSATHPAQVGTKSAAFYRLNLAPGESQTMRLRLCNDANFQSLSINENEPLGSDFASVFAQRIDEANQFYEPLLRPLEGDARMIARQAYAGLLWTKQFYYYNVRDWLRGDPNRPAPPTSRHGGRNADWIHLANRDVISMPDKWEYPWYAAWDLAFHMIPMAKVDMHFAKQQILLFLREWFMHPSGQIPAYEFALGDANPPVHAWAALRVYQMGKENGECDRVFLARVFHKLLINFTWWINRKDRDDNHIFSGGFLGLDNIGVFDRSQPSPFGGHLDQADATAWMAFYCSTMLSIALELAREDPSYEDVASKFFEHFVAIADAMNKLGGSGLWNEEDGFYYDHLHRDDQYLAVRLRSLVGLLPMVAASVLDVDLIDQLPGFKKRMIWFLENRKELASQITYLEKRGDIPKMMLAIPSRSRLQKLLRVMLDETEFLSDFGIRSMSKSHESEPFTLALDGRTVSVAYTPGESDTGLFGGNSNWRGPIWFPINYLIIEALETYFDFYGDTLTVECPAGSGQELNMKQVACELSRRLSKIFLKDEAGNRAVFGDDQRYTNNNGYQDLVLFYEYFHGCSGKGLGASHQTGWTALIINCLEKINNGCQK